MEYLSKHPSFSKLGFFTLKKLAYEILTLKKTYGDPIIRKGQQPDGLYIIKNGKISVKLFLILKITFNEEDTPSRG